MDAITNQQIENLQSKNADKHHEAFQYLIAITRQPVDWAYEVWDDLLTLLRTGDNHQRAIAAQLLSNLAKSDPKGRMEKDLDRLVELTKDERFVTARHSLQSLWKVGVVNTKLQQLVTDRLSKRFRECINEKNCTLIRYDILQAFHRMYDATQDEQIKKLALSLIETEEDDKYRKKYTGLWKDLLKESKP